MEKALWLSPHKILPEQEKELEEMGYIVERVSTSQGQQIYEDMLNSPDSFKESFLLAERLYRFCENYGFVAIVQPAGNLLFQFALGLQARHHDVVVIYAHSERKSIEEIVGNEVIKKSIFTHVKFIETV